MVMGGSRCLVTAIACRSKVCGLHSRRLKHAANIVLACKGVLWVLIRGHQRCPVPRCVLLPDCRAHLGGFAGGAAIAAVVAPRYHR